MSARPTAEQIERRAREICIQERMDPDFPAYVGDDELGKVYEPNWKQFENRAEDELMAEIRAAGASIH